MSASVSLELRREAARRLPAQDCGCRDPWLCEHEAPQMAGGPADPWCCAAMPVEQALALAKLGRFCTVNRCARRRSSC